MRDELLGRPVVDRDYVVVGDVEGYVHLLRKDDGSVVGRRRAASAPILADLLRSSGSIVVQARDGSVSAIGVE